VTIRHTPRSNCQGMAQGNRLCVVPHRYWVRPWPPEGNRPGSGV